MSKETKMQAIEDVADRVITNLDNKLVSKLCNVIETQTHTLTETIEEQSASLGESLESASNAVAYSVEDLASAIRENKQGGVAGEQTMPMQPSGSKSESPKPTPF